MAGATVEEISSKAPPAVAKSTPTAAKLGCAFSHSAERTVEVSLSQPCFEHFFRPCFRGHDEAGLLAFEALRGSRGLESL